MHWNVLVTLTLCGVLCGTAAAESTGLFIGLNSVNPGAYDGWNGELKACENDAQAMMDLAGREGIGGVKMLSAGATRDAVIAAINAITQQMQEGDYFILTYSGHGTQVEDLNGDEADGKDEAWCLYDGLLVDDELNELLCKAPAGSRILVISDSCHSGTVIKGLDLIRSLADTEIGKSATTFLTIDEPSTVRLKLGPAEATAACFANHLQAHREAQARTKGETVDLPAASVALLSGCQDNQYSYDALPNGFFTGALLLVWDRGGYPGNTHTDFHAAIVSKMPFYQTPNLMPHGTDTEKIIQQRPFTP